MPPSLKQKGRKWGPGPWWDQPCRPTSFAPEGVPLTLSFLLP